MLQIRQLKLKCYLQVTYRNSALWQSICQAVFVNRRSCSNAQWLVCPSVPLASHTVRANLKHVFTAARLLASSASKLRFSQPVLLFLVARLANQRLDTVMTPPSLADRRRTNAGLVYRSGQRASQEQTQLHLCLQREAISASGSGIWQNECFSEIPAKLESVDCRARFSVLEAEYGQSVDSRCV